MFSQKKPYTAVTVNIERLTNESHSENDLSGLPDLVELIQLQHTGPEEAARAIRKKLKYGNIHRQLRALTLLDALIHNAGQHFLRAFADEPLLERLRFCGTAPLSDPAVKKKCAELFRSWAVDYKKVRGMEQVVNLYRQLPRRKHGVTKERSKTVKETENPFGDDEDESSPAPPPAPGPSRSSVSSTAGHARNSSSTCPTPCFDHFAKDKKKKDKSKKSKLFNLAAEKEQMKVHMAEASIAATSLINVMQTINRETERISENQKAVHGFETVKLLRRKILRHILHAEDEKYLGSLLHANDELVQALMTFEQLDKAVNIDSDSDDEIAAQAHLYRKVLESARGKGSLSPTSPSGTLDEGMSALKDDNAPPKPPRPMAPPRPSAASKPAIRPSVLQSGDGDDEDENDPFADRNAAP